MGAVTQPQSSHQAGLIHPRLPCPCIPKPPCHLEFGNEGEEELPLQPVLIQRVWSPVVSCFMRGVVSAGHRVLSVLCHVRRLQTLKPTHHPHPPPPVAGGHEHEPRLPQPAKQAVQDHGVSHVGHKELIEREHLSGVF